MFMYMLSAGALLAAFGCGWRLSLQRVPPSPDMAASPLQPLLVTAVRAPGVAASSQDAADVGDGMARSGGAASAAAPAVELGFAAADVAGPAAAQMAAIERVQDLLLLTSPERWLYMPKIHRLRA